MVRSLFLVLMAVSALAGCGSEPPKTVTQAEKKPAEPAIPQELQDAAKAVLGSEAEVLQYGDLAKNGKQQILVADVVPNTPKSTVVGTVVTRAVIAENDDGRWVELFRCDEHLKNSKGFYMRIARKRACRCTSHP
jgi:PBP1b-binding outer membrane lipoprotein LpoB